MGRTPYLPRGHALGQTADVLRPGGEYNPSYITVPKGTPCPKGYRAVELESINPSDIKYCELGSGPAYLPGEQAQQLTVGVLSVALPLAIAFVIFLIVRGATTLQHSGEQASKAIKRPALTRRILASS